VVTVMAVALHLIKRLRENRRCVKSFSCGWGGAGRRMEPCELERDSRRQQ